MGAPGQGCPVLVSAHNPPSAFQSAALRKLEQQSYEVKRGKYTAVKGKGQKRFIRFRTLGTGYGEDEIKAVLEGKAKYQPHQKQPLKEEVTRGAVTLIVDGAKLSEQVFEKAVKKFLKEIQKSQEPKIYRGRQSLKQLASQNAGLANIEISDKNIKAFSRVAKKYHVDFALKKDTAAEQPRYLVFFKSRDADAITAAFQEFASRKMSREEKPSIRERLTQAKEQAAEKTEHRTIDREKVKVKDRSVQR